MMQKLFWQDFVDVVQEELLNLKSQMSEKTLLYDVRSIDNLDDLRTINKSFGTYVDLTLMDELTDAELLEYMKQETEGLIFKVQYKGSYEYYKYVFNRVYERGNAYLGFVDGVGGLLRGINYDLTLESFKDHDVTTPFLNTSNVFPTFDQKVERYTLDSPERETFDAGWYFDPVLVGQTLSISKHLFIEFIADEIVEGDDDSNYYLLAPRHFRYLQNSINNRVQRKATTIVHSGVQLTLYADTEQSVYTIPSLDASSYSTVNYSSATDAEVVKVGNELGTMYYEREISSVEVYTAHESYDMINIWIPAHKVGPETLATGDGAETQFDSDDSTYTNGVIEYPEIVKKFLRITWTHDSTEYTAYDDGEGVITAADDEVTGTVDYTTGEYTLNFYRDSDTTYFTPDSGTDIDVTYYTKQQLLIEKVQIIDSSDNVILEGTFAPVDFNDWNNYLAIQFVIEKGES